MWKIPSHRRRLSEVPEPAGDTAKYSQLAQDVTTWQLEIFLLTQKIESHLPFWIYIHQCNNSMSHLRCIHQEFLTPIFCLWTNPSREGSKEKRVGNLQLWSAQAACHTGCSYTNRYPRDPNISTTTGNQLFSCKVARLWKPSEISSHLNISQPQLKGIADWASPQVWLWYTAQPLGVSKRSTSPVA